MSIYATGKNIAEKMFARFGQPIELVRTQRTIDPVSGTVEASASQEYSGVGILSQYEMKTVEQSSVLKFGDIRLVCAGIPDVDPTTDQIKINGRVYSVVAPAIVVAPAGDTVVQEVPVR